MKLPVLNFLKAEKTVFFSAFATVIISVILGVIIALLLEPTSKPKNVFLSNISDHQITITWTTNDPVRSAILISENNKFPFTPLFNKSLIKDDFDKTVSHQGFYSTHKVTITNLKPSKAYQYRIYEGIKQVYSGQFLTGKTLDSLSGPSPVYGRVLLSNKQTPLVGGIIYLTASDGKNNSSILSILTNREGRFDIDLSNLRSSNLGSPFPLSSKTKLMIVVDGGSKGKAKIEGTVGKAKPLPDIILMP